MINTPDACIVIRPLTRSQELPFNFRPIEPPRPPVTGAETFARQKQRFAATPVTPQNRGKSKPSFLHSKLSLGSSTAPPVAPFISLEVRLPEPAILTCGQPVPLRIICTELEGPASDCLALTHLEVRLAHYTYIRAHDVVRTETGAVMLASRNGMNTPLKFNAGSVEINLDSSAGWSLTVPQTLPSSFETCNIRRSYELLARLGVRYDQPDGQAQYAFKDLRIPVSLYSGTRPPAELLDATASAAASGGPPLPPRQQSASQRAQTTKPPTYSMQSGGPTAGEGAPGVNAAPPVYSDAPPSYEDAIADTMPSVNAEMRPEYGPPAPVEGQDRLLSGDEKRGWH